MASATAVAGRRRGSGGERLGRFLDRWLLPLYVVGVTAT